MEQKYQILAVDDDQELLNLLMSELSTAGFKVTQANDGDEAIARVQKKRFDLVILDIKMPKVNGIETLKYIKKHFPATKVIMLTAFADLQNALESKRNGAEGFLDKPCDIDELITLMNRILTT